MRYCPNLPTCQDLLEKKKFYYLSSCWADAIREAVTWGEEEGGVLLFSNCPTFFKVLLFSNRLTDKTKAGNA